MKRVFSFLLTLCLLLTALLSGAALAEGSTQITIGLVGEPDTIIPYMYTADKDAMVIMQMMPYLFKRNDETSIPEPLMLESCEFDADTLTYTWKLREGYTWTDGEPLTIDDVISRSTRWQARITPAARVRTCPALRAMRKRTAAKQWA